MSLDEALEWMGRRVAVASTRYQEVHDHFTRLRASLAEVNEARHEWERATALLRQLQARKAVAA